MGLGLGLGLGLGVGLGVAAAPFCSEAAMSCRQVRVTVRVRVRVSYRPPCAAWSSALTVSKAAASAKPEGGGMSGPGTPKGRAPKPLPRASMRTW